MIICVWGVAPLVRAYVSGVHKIVEYDNRLAAIEEITQEEAEALKAKVEALNLGDNIAVYPEVSVILNIVKDLFTNTNALQILPEDRTPSIELLRNELSASPAAQKTL